MTRGFAWGTAAFVVFSIAWTAMCVWGMQWDERRNVEAGTVLVATSPEGVKVYKVWDRHRGWRMFAVGADGSVSHMNGW